MGPGRKTGQRESGTAWSRDKFVSKDGYGGTQAHVTHWKNDGQGSSERTSSDLNPSSSGGWTVENTHTTKQ
jgi:hypothetical protein